MNNSQKYFNQQQVALAEKDLSNKDPRMKMLIEKWGPCAIQPWSKIRFNALIEIIIGQQLSVAAAKTIIQRFYDLFGTTSISPEQILNIEDPILRQAGLSRAKANYCKGIAQAVVNGELHFESLEQQSLDVVLDNLIQLKGVGLWSAQMYAIFVLGFQDVWSFGDLGLKKAVAHLNDLEALPSEQQFIQAGNLWQPHRSIASWYCWRLVESLKQR